MTSAQATSARDPGRPQEAASREAATLPWPPRLGENASSARPLGPLPKRSCGGCARENSMRPSRLCSSSTKIDEGREKARRLSRRLLLGPRQREGQSRYIFLPPPRHRTQFHLIKRFTHRDRPVLCCEERRRVPMLHATLGLDSSLPPQHMRRDRPHARRVTRTRTRRSPPETSRVDPARTDPTRPGPAGSV